MSLEVTIQQFPTILDWCSLGRALDRAVWAFEDELEGPLRTAPEAHEGWGGCPALRPQYDPPRTSNKLYRWNRWWLAMDRRHKRVGRRRLLLARMGLDPRVIEVPGWVS